MASDDLFTAGDASSESLSSELIEAQQHHRNGSAKITANGLVKHDSSGDGDGTQEDRIAELEAELERTREERESYASQYRNLLSKIQTMRTTLGNKLKEDAEELDRREQAINGLTQQNDDLKATVETLESELIQSNDESERLTKELDTSRTRIKEYEQTSRESVIRDRELRELREESERLRLNKEELERSLQQERLLAANSEELTNELRKELETERMTRIRLEDTLEKETERSNNLQGVLEDFQTGKDMELQRAVQETQARLDSISLSLAEYKHRANQAELELETRSSSADRIEKLEAELKEKSLLLGKLRHQSVILNEHLTEALRRLHKNSSDNNVDRRLVTNILLSFLTTPRGDAKRFEMLSILSTILGWTEEDRERAGLQRSLYGALTAHSPTKKKMPRLDSSSSSTSGTDQSESFSNMWVEFLMKEAAQGQGLKAGSLTTGSRRPSTSGNSDSGSTLGSLPLLSPRSEYSSSSNMVNGKRIASLGNLSSVELSKPPGTGTKSGEGVGKEEKSSERRLL